MSVTADSGGSAGMQEMEMSVQINLADWEVNVPIPEDIFTFLPPADAETKVCLFEGVMLGGETHRMVGGQAPAFAARSPGRREAEMNRLHSSWRAAKV
jgi:hypothetical protein